MRGARRGDAQPPGAAWRAQPATRRGSWTAQLDRCSIKQKRKNDQTVVPPGGGTVEDNSHPDESIWGESSLHQTRGAPYSRYCFVYLTFSQTTPAVIAGCEAAWAFYGGMFKVLIAEKVPR